MIKLLCCFEFVDEMINFVYSEERASSNIASHLKQILELEKSTGSLAGVECFEDQEHRFRMLKVDCRIIDADFIDGMVEGLTIFLSRHSSTKQIPAFTVHSEGNWTDDCNLGGMPKSLSVASPANMLKLLKCIKKLNNTGIELTYEATHHGPLMNQPSFFVELGGNDEAIGNYGYAELIARAVADAVNSEVHYDKVALGIGSLHYPEKFTRLALEGKYAFSHIMSKHYVKEIDMLGDAFKRSDILPDVALIEWKGIKAADRQVILKELDRLGIDYAKV
jgi:D-aminoacyl-tRNA deacylase